MFFVDSKVFRTDLLQNDKLNVLCFCLMIMYGLNHTAYRDVRCDLIGQGWVSFQDTENEVEERKSEVHKVLSTGRRVMTELNFGKLLIVNFTNNLLLGAMVF